MIWVIKIEIGEWTNPRGSVPAKLLGTVHTVEGGHEMIERDIKDERIFHSDFERVPGFIDTYQYVKLHNAVTEEKVKVRYIMMDTNFEV